jgi:diguanylate cyclase (GGDEF)-like protein
MFDIDFFKEVNDEFGHIVGDQVLVRLTEEITTQVRLEDTFARYGGEEFVIILSNSNIEQVIEKAEKLREHVKEVEFNNGISITLSFGVTQFNIGESSEEMFQRVDEALYEAKEAGRDSVVSRK